MVIDDKRSMAASYWTEEYFEKLDVTEYRASARSYIRVFSSDGTLLYTFKSNKEAYETLNLTKNIVQNAVQRKTLSHGYYFLKDGDDIEEIMRGIIKEKPIHIYNYDGSYIETLYTLYDVKQKYGFNKNDIKRAIKTNNMYNGLFWSHEEYKNVLKENPNFKISEIKKIYQYDLQGNFIREWNSVSECRKEFPAVTQVLLGKRKHCHKMTFSYDKLMIQSKA